MSYETSREVTDELALVSERLTALQKKIAFFTSLTEKVPAHPVDSPRHLGEQLNERRKALKLDLYTLELQTGISSSTLKRLFKDPEQVKFGSVFAVAQALGVKLCTDE
ncbi:helix-turn-helix transcriptional regulator [Superficieibacter sp.]|uniref:helix-turn-helix transcriptional regulator n=1 Tax=Superficieibacter sp. TaxID=2303322 RepID=UPI0028AEB8D5|nr:helix-turn-helix transcriptional regulator [Superficieibacter sp.]